MGSIFSHRKWTQADLETIKYMYVNKGIRQSQIARYFRVSDSTISNKLKEIGAKNE